MASATPRSGAAATREDAGAAATWVCVPTYNEAENVETLVDRVLEVFARHRIDGRVLVIDDASPDGTGRIADGLAAADDRVRVLHRAGKQGIGPAYRDGFRQALDAGAERIVEMDCDLSHDPEALPSLLTATLHADLVIGSRYVPGGRIEDWGLVRRMISRFGCWYAQAILAIPVRDLTGGFKCFRREVLDAAAPRRGRCRRLRVPGRDDLPGVARGLSGRRGPDHVPRARPRPVEDVAADRGRGRRARPAPSPSPRAPPRAGPDGSGGRREMRRSELQRARGVLAPPRLGEKTRDDWMRVLRFCVVGGSGYVVNLIVFASLVHAFDVHYAIAAVASFCVAVTNNFLLNKYWTFQRHEERAHTQGVRYLVVSLVALGLNLLLLEGLIALHVPAVPANALAVIAVTPVNFLLNHRWTFVPLDEPVAADTRRARSGDRPT